MTSLPTTSLSLRTALAALLLLPALAGAAGEARHPWLTSPVPVPPPLTYFTNLKDGDRIETPFVLKFGLSRTGLAAISKEVPATGHHHLLVNRELPLDFTQPLPFNDQYRHFGKGQMETVLDFKPGTYSLRLLLADHKHIPYFIYSKPLTVTVVAKNEQVDPKSLVKPGVALLAPRDGQTLATPLHLQFHASGLNVSHADVVAPDTGHFRLVAQGRGGAAERIEFGDGATEAWLRPPPGEYQLRLELVANTPGAAVLASSAPINVRVSR